MRHPPLQIGNDLYALGHADVPIFALRAGPEQWALVDGGLAADARVVLEQLAPLVGDLRRLRWWFVTHSHYDHCGAIPLLLPHLPALEVVGSAGLAAAFASKRAAAVRTTLDRRAAELRSVRLEDLAGWLGAPMPLTDVPVHVVDDEECFPLGSHTAVRCLASPGHSQDHMAFSWQSNLFVGDALGEFAQPCAFCPLAFSNVGAYRLSISRLEGAGGDRVIFGHNTFVEGPRCRSIFRDATAALESFCRETKQALASGRDVSAIADAYHERHRNQSQGFLPADLHRESMCRLSSLVAQEA